MNKKLIEEYDVVVVGGGFAGFGAAMGAAQSGAKTLLLEATGVLGGLAVNGLVNPFMKFDYQGEELIKGVFGQLVDRLERESAYYGRAFNYEAVKYNLIHMLEKAGVDILLYHQVTGVKTEARRIKKIIAHSHGQEIELKSELYIDCTGDGILAKLADHPILSGDEESGHNQAMTQMFVLDNVDFEETMRYVRNNQDDFFSWVNPHQRPGKDGTALSIAGFFKLVEKAEGEGFDLPRDHFFFIKLPGEDAVVVNTGHITVDDANDPFVISKSQIQGMKQTRELFRFAKEYLPGFENINLRQSASQIGIRESARIKGEYIFKQEDVENFRKFDDAVVKAIYGVDIHKNIDEKSEKEVKLDYSNYYEIPARALIARELDNLMMAGRNLSADFGGQSAVRIMPTCCGMGQGAGVIAALAVKEDTIPGLIPAQDFQKELKRQGVNIS